MANPHCGDEFMAPYHGKCEVRWMVPRPHSLPIRSSTGTFAGTGVSLTSPALLILLTKAVLIADMVAIVAFVLDYSRLARWWRNPVGRTIVIKDLFLLGVISLIVASVFFQFSRFTSEVASWIQIALLGGMAVAMLWR